MDLVYKKYLLNEVVYGFCKHLDLNFDETKQKVT